MKAVYISEPGGPEALEVREVPAPEPGAGEVLIDVVAAGLNRADVQQRKGHYPPPPGASEIPGLEVSGRIAGFGPGVTKPFSVGDKVVALLAGGGYAQQVAVPAGQVLRVPEGVDLVTAASLPEVAATVYSNLVMTAQLQPGETVLIHGATGGIGTMAIQLAKAFGAVVATTAGTAEKVGTAKAFLGADIAINYAEEDFPESLRAQNGGKGADVILDVVGAKYLSGNVDALADYGRLVVIGLQGGSKGGAGPWPAAAQAGRHHRHGAAAAAGRGEDRDHERRPGRRLAAAGGRPDPAAGGQDLPAGPGPGRAHATSTPATTSARSSW